MPFVSFNNENIFYASRGDSGMPVVFIHGAGANHLVWGAQLGAAGENARAYALDLPGHGRSEGRGRDSIEGYRDALVGFLDALGIERAVIVGHSMGGAIAQTLALSHPARIAGLVLVSTGARLRVLPAILDGILTDFDNTVRTIVQYMFAADAEARLSELSEEQLRACAPEVTHADFAACNAFDVMARVGEIAAPTLVIVGRDDQMTPLKFSEFLASKIRDARLIVVERAGHSVMLEQPEVVNEAVRAFVKKS